MRLKSFHRSLKKLTIPFHQKAESNKQRNNSSNLTFKMKIDIIYSCPNVHEKVKSFHDTVIKIFSFHKIVNRVLTDVAHRLYHDIFYF